MADAGQPGQQVRRRAQEMLHGRVELRELTTTLYDHRQQGHT